jgi:hypothetical protein
MDDLRCEVLPGLFEDSASSLIQSPNLISSACKEEYLRGFYEKVVLPRGQEPCRYWPRGLASFGWPSYVTLCYILADDMELTLFSSTLN